MAHLYAGVKGNRGEATRLGTTSIHAWAQGWDVGIDILGYQEGDEDCFAVYLTSGSDGRQHRRLIGVFKKEDLDEKKEEV